MEISKLTSITESEAKQICERCISIKADTQCG